MKALGELLAKAKTVKSDDKALIKKLRAMLQTSEDQLRSFKKQSNFLSQLAAKTMPKGLHCVSMRLTVDYGDLSPAERQFPNQQNLEDTRLYHYALFSDNVLAAAVVVNSTVTNAKVTVVLCFQQPTPIIKSIRLCISQLGHYLLFIDTEFCASPN